MAMKSFSHDREASRAERLCHLQTRRPVVLMQKDGCRARRHAIPLDIRLIIRQTTHAPRSRSLPSPPKLANPVCIGALGRISACSSDEISEAVPIGFFFCRRLLVRFLRFVGSETLPGDEGSREAASSSVSPSLSGPSVSSSATSFLSCSVCTTLSLNSSCSRRRCLEAASR